MEIGSVVWLKSGSPAMTVTSSDRMSTDKMYCTWFLNGMVQCDTFPVSALTFTRPAQYADSGAYTKILPTEVKITKEA